jgi:hypothetical protein
MNNIKPFLAREIPTLKWKIREDRSAIENLQDALTQISKLHENLEENRLPPKEHTSTQRKLLKTLEEANLNLLSVKILQTTLARRKFNQLSKELSKTGIPALSSILLSLYAKSQRLRHQAARQTGARYEIEAEYFAQLSLYQMEIDRRTKND